MNSRMITLGLTLLCATAQTTMAQAHADKTLFIGKVELPTTINALFFPLRVYYDGAILQTDVESNKILFSISKSNSELLRQARTEREITFNMLITSEIKTPNNNTIEHLQLCNDVPYKCYRLKLSVTQDLADESHVHFGNKSDEKELFNHWEITPITLEAKNGEVPLNTFVVMLDAKYVKGLVEETSRSGVVVRLPKIVLKEDVITHLGSENELRDKAAERVLAALDLDTIHCPMRQEIKQNVQLGIIQVALHDNNMDAPSLL